MPAIKLDSVSFQYDETAGQALKNVNLTIHPKEWVSVVGRNGSGKSTFGRLLNGLLLPTQGKVFINGVTTNDEKQLWEIRRIVGMVFQNPDHQFVATTVRDELAFGLENLGLSRDEMSKRMERYASLIGVSSLLDMEPHRLSGGQKQRVAIAATMVMEPHVIVFDEATSMLDPIGRKEVLATMKRLHQLGSTIVSITHDMDEAILGDRIIVFHQGEKIADDSPPNIFSNEPLLARVGLKQTYAMTMQKQLKKRGISMNKLCLTEEELMSELWTLLSIK